MKRWQDKRGRDGTYPLRQVLIHPKFLSPSVLPSVIERERDQSF